MLLLSPALIEWAMRQLDAEFRHSMTPFELNQLKHLAGLTAREREAYFARIEHVQGVRAGSELRQAYRTTPDPRGA